MADTHDPTADDGGGPAARVPSREPDATSAAPGGQSLSDVLGELADEGWDGQMAPVEGGTVRCLTCREELDPGSVEQGPLRRLEGVSDPADMLLVVGLRCPSCGTRGVLVANYGPEAPPGDADVVAALPH